MQKKPRTAKVALIGQPVVIVSADNPSLKGIRGKAVDETRNTITIMTLKGEKKIIKDQVTLRIEENTIDGKRLDGRPEERIKNS